MPNGNQPLALGQAMMAPPQYATAPGLIDPYRPAPPVALPMAPPMPPPTAPPMLGLSPEEQVALAQSAIDAAGQAGTGGLGFQEAGGAGVLTMPGGGMAPGQDVFALSDPRDVAQVQDYIGGAQLMRRPKWAEVTPEARTKRISEVQAQRKGTAAPTPAPAPEAEGDKRRGMIADMLSDAIRAGDDPGMVLRQLQNIPADQIEGLHREYFAVPTPKKGVSKE